MAATSWRLYITASQAGGNIAIGEIEMRASFGGADQCTGGTPIRSAEQFGLLAPAAFDNSVATAWASNNTIPAWIGYTFASAVDVVELAVTAWSDATFWTLAPKDFQLQFSNDGFATPGTIAYVTAGVTWTSAGQTKLFNIGANAALESTKAATYADLGPPSLLTSTKAVTYAVVGIGNTPVQRITTAVLRGSRAAA